MKKVLAGYVQSEPTRSIGSPMNSRISLGLSTGYVEDDRAEDRAAFTVRDLRSQSAVTQCPRVFSIPEAFWLPSDYQ